MCTRLKVISTCFNSVKLRKLEDLRTECKYYHIQLCKILTLLNIKRTLDNTKRAHTQSKKGHIISFFQKVGGGGGTVRSAAPDLRTECKYYHIQLCKILTLLNIKRTLDNTKRAHTQSKKGHIISFFQKVGGGEAPCVPRPLRYNVDL